VRSSWGSGFTCRDAGTGLLSEAFNLGANAPGPTLDAIGMNGPYHYSAAPVYGVASFCNGILIDALGDGSNPLRAPLPQPWCDGGWLAKLQSDSTRPGDVFAVGYQNAEFFGTERIQRPIVALAAGTGTTALTTDGNRIAGSEQFWTVGSAATCTVANNSLRRYDSFVVALSTGSASAGSYLPDPRFGVQGWARIAVTSYDQTSVTAPIRAWRAEFVQPSTSLQPADLYVVGEFPYDSASNDYDWFVAKVSMLPASGLAPVDAIFRDGFEQAP
jgi:hypothetical protein